MIEIIFYNFSANKILVLLFILSGLDLLNILLARIKQKYKKKILKIVYYNIN